MKLFRRKAPQIAPLPEREPDLYIGGRPMWIVGANQDDVARRRAAEDRERAIERRRMRESNPPPFHLWMDT